MLARSIARRVSGKVQICTRALASSRRAASSAVPSTSPLLSQQSRHAVAAALCGPHGAQRWPVNGQVAFSTSSSSANDEEAQEVEEVDEDDEEVFETSSSVTSEGIEVVVRRRNIRGSWKKINYLTRLVGGMYAMDALEQMAYTKKRKGLIMRDLINLGAVRALQDHDIPIERLRIERAIVNKGPIAKRGRFHARGRTGKNYHRYSHLYLSLREVEPKPAQEQLESGFTRTPGWSSPPRHSGDNAPKGGRAARRAANAAANAAALGGRLAQ